MKVELAYIGRSFYLNSGTMMSPLIPVGETEKKRWDWGKVQIALEEGLEVSIRPATSEELGEAYKRLQEVKDR